MPSFRCGVLFVHGIGEQEQGETLVLWTDALQSWLEGWLGPLQIPHEGAAVLTDAVVRPGARDTPAHAALTLRIPGREDPVQWLLAEAWWARSFLPPKPAAVRRWLLDIGPWIAVRHLGTIVRRAWLARSARRVPRTALAVLAALLLLPLAAAAVLAISVLGLAGMLPPLRRPVAAANRAFSASIGDSHLLATSPTQFEAMQTEIRRSLEWLSERCAHVVIVAHSQGAALTQELLQSLCPPNVRTYLTLGSGIDKLQFFLRLRRVRGRRLLGALTLLGLAWIAVWAPYVAVSALMAPETARLGAGDIGARFALSLLGLAPVFVTYAVSLSLIRDAERIATASLTASPGPPFRWVDVYASADPVPNGPLEESYGVSESRQVWNLGSFLRDHSAYPFNRDEFLPLLAGEIGAACGIDLSEVAPGDRSEIRAASGRRRRRVLTFVALRAAALAAFVAVSLVWSRHAGRWLARRLSLEDPWRLPAPLDLITPGVRPEAFLGVLAFGAALLLSWMLLGRIQSFLNDAAANRLLARRRG